MHRPPAVTECIGLPLNSLGKLIDKFTILRIKWERIGAAPAQAAIELAHDPIDIRARQFDAHFIELARPGYAATDACREIQVSGSAIVAEKSYRPCD
jgi:hypothetical protein